MAIKEEIEIVVKKGQAEKSLKDLDKGVKKTDKSTKELTGNLDKMSGGVVSGFNNLKGGIGKAITSFKSLRVAIIGTGIGALLIAILSLKEAFTSSEEGQNKFAKILGVIGSITGNLSDLLSNLGMKIIDVFENPKQAIKDFAKLIKDNIINRFNGLLELIPSLSKAVNQFFRGDFSGAAETAGNAVAKVTLGVDNLTESIKKTAKELKEFAEEVAKDAKTAEDIADKRAKADKLDRELIVERAKANKDIADLRFKTEQRDKFSALERVQFLKDASKIQDDITDKELASAKLRYDAQVAENGLANSKKTDKDAEANAEAKLIQLETKRLNSNKRLQTQIQSTNNEIKAKNKLALKASKDVLDREEKERIKKAEADAKSESERLSAIAKIQEEFKKKNEDLEDEDNLAKLERQYDRDLMELEALNATEQQKYELKKYYAGLISDEEEKIVSDFADSEEKAIRDLEDKRQDDALKRIQLEEQVANAKKNIANRTASLLIELAGKASKIGKAIAVAQTIRSGIEGVQNAYSTAQKSPITTLFPAYPVVQAGLAGTFSALQVKKILSTPDTGGGGGGSQGGGQDTGAPSFNLVQGTPENQLAETIGNTNQQPINAFVVGSSVTNQQELDRNRIEESSL